MKLGFTLLLAIISNLAIGQEGWSNQIPASDYPGLYGIYALDSENIWIVGEDGTLLHSTDGGLLWENITIETEASLYAVEFINADTGWVTGDDDGLNSTVFRTIDGGLTWEPQEVQGPGSYVPIWDVDFVPGEEEGSMRGYLAGGLFYTWRTDDYGESWLSLQGNCGEGNLKSTSFIDMNTGWFVGTPSVTVNYSIMCTSDGGDTWDSQVNPTDQPLRGVCFADTQHGLAVGLVGTILYTGDGGENWEARPNTGYRWESVCLNQTGKAWVVGSDGDVAYSTDWGYSWEMQESGVNCELWDVYFINDNEGWIVGGGIGQPGVILHTVNGGIVSVVEENIAEDFDLLQNVPNPFSQNTRIIYRSRIAVSTSLTIFNALGNEVASFHNEGRNPGEYTYEFGGSEYPAGIYFYQLKAEGIAVGTGKMTMLH